MKNSLFNAVFVCTTLIILGFSQHAKAVSYDIFYLVDDSGDMGSVMPDLSNTIRDSMAIAFTDLDDVAIGVGTYVDFLDPPYGSGQAGIDIPFELLTPMTTDLFSAQNATNQFNAQGGGDQFESSLFALHSVASNVPNIGWRSDSVKVIFWTGNNPGHDGDLEPDYSVCCTDIGLSDTINALTNENIVVYSFNLFTFASLGLDGTGQASAITSATGGTAFDITSGDVSAYATTINRLAAIPAPASLWLFCSGLIGLFGFARYKK